MEIRKSDYCGEGFFLECLGWHGPTISPANRYIGQEIEIWRWDHRYSNIFAMFPVDFRDLPFLKKYKGGKFGA